MTKQTKAKPRGAAMHQPEVVTTRKPLYAPGQGSGAVGNKKGVRPASIKTVSVKLPPSWGKAPSEGGK